MVMDISGDMWVTSTEGLRFLNLVKEGDLAGYSPQDLPIREVWFLDLADHYQSKVRTNFFALSFLQWIKNLFGEEGPQDEEGMKVLFVMGGGYPWSNSVLEGHVTRYGVLDFLREKGGK